MLVLRDLVNKRYFYIYFLIFYYCIQQHYFNLRDNNKAKQ